ncbi:DUF6264 family protein [Agromyces sp. NPDC058104]|uniref:DUF6264 family protein n=1 Tax=Agromyces sp. NPDC058104 TaxID=3346342 RepID=UPI0036DA8C26
MTRDEAAQTPDDGATNAAASQPPAAPPADERPRPRYGEYAPEGWTWQPPADPYSGGTTPEPAAAGPAAGSVHGAPLGAPVPTYPQQPGAVARPTDRAWTVALLVFGAMGAVYNTLSIIAMPSNILESLTLSASMFGTTPPDEFAPGPAVPVAIAVGVIAQFALWVGALMWSRARMRAGASSWWIPLLAGVAAFLVVMVVTYVVAFSDPALVEFFLTPPTTAP